MGAAAYAVAQRFKSEIPTFCGDGIIRFKSDVEAVGVKRLGNLIGYCAGKFQQEAVLGGMAVPKTQEVMSFLGGELFERDVDGVLLFISDGESAEAVVQVVFVAAAIF